MKNFLLAVMALSVFAISSCKKDKTPEPVTPTTGSLRITFNNTVDGDPLVLGGPYHWINAHGDSFYINTYKYYISNIKLTDSNGNTWYEPESYHLVNQADASSFSFVIGNVPNANYTAIQYMIGVDSARNNSGSQTGALDPANDMFWTWSTGYIMAKVEGKSNVSVSSGNNITFHIAGYEGQYASQRVVSPSFGSLTANVSSTTTPVIHIESNLNEWWRNPSVVRFDMMSNVTTTGPNAMIIADNYMDMFTVTGIDN